MPYEVLRELRSIDKPYWTGKKAVTWPKEEWLSLKEFAEANGFENLDQGFSYLGFDHFY